MHRHSTCPFLQTSADEEVAEKETAAMSQRFSQLSTDNDCEQELVAMNRKRQLSASSSPIVPSKRMRTDDLDQKQLDDVPAYLLTTNSAFLRVVQKVLTASSSISVTDLQLVA